MCSCYCGVWPSQPLLTQKVMAALPALILLALFQLRPPVNSTLKTVALGDRKSLRLGWNRVERGLLTSVQALPMRHPPHFRSSPLVLLLEWFSLFLYVECFIHMSVWPFWQWSVSSGSSIQWVLSKCLCSLFLFFRNMKVLSLPLIPASNRTLLYDPTYPHF